jgi:hypothetical protein
MEAETLGQGYLISPLVTSGKRKLRWFQQTLKEAKANVGDPKRQFRGRRAPKRIWSYLAMVTSITDEKPHTFAREVDQ